MTKTEEMEARTAHCASVANATSYKPTSDKWTIVYQAAGLSWDALRNVPEGLVEEAAKAIYGVGQGHADEPWERAHSRTKMTYRSMASAALAAPSRSHDSTLADELERRIANRKDSPGRVNPVCLSPHLAERILAALRSTPAPDALREAEDKAIASARKDGATDDDIAAHWTAYCYLRAALRTEDSRHE